MDEVQIRNILDTFQSVGFDKMHEHQLRRIAHHYTKAKGKLMIVISHSTTHDFLLGLLLFGRTKIPTTMFTNFKNPFLTMFANNLGMITHQDGKSNTQAIIDQLRKKKDYVFLISLARTAAKQKVQSGYFYIARELQLPIIVIGFDYFLRTGYVSEKRISPPPKKMEYSEFQIKFEPTILGHIQQICPFKPHFQTGFSIDTYLATYPNFRREDIFEPDLKLLYACRFLLPLPEVTQIKTCYATTTAVYNFCFLFFFFKKKRRVLASAIRFPFFLKKKQKIFFFFKKKETQQKTRNVELHKKKMRTKVKYLLLYGCEYCTKRFRRRYHLTEHVRTHTGERPFKCHHCNYSAIQSSNLKKHILAIHGKHQQLLPLVQDIIPQEEEWNREETKQPATRRYVCTQCNYQCIFEARMLKHQHVHLEFAFAPPCKQPNQRDSTAHNQQCSRLEQQIDCPVHGTSCDVYIPQDTQSVKQCKGYKSYEEIYDTPVAHKKYKRSKEEEEEEEEDEPLTQYTLMKQEAFLPIDNSIDDDC